MSDCEVLVIGSGLTGATLARLLRDAAKAVIVVERRPHIGGNVRDHRHPSGIVVHDYGPHYFRTSSMRIWQFVNRFSVFRPFAAILKTIVAGRYENWPISADYIVRAVGAGWRPEFAGTPRNFEEACLAMMPRPVYEQFVRDYTEKQWGVPAADLSADLAGRFGVRMSNDERLKTSRYQGIPSVGYSSFMQRMLTGIPVAFEYDYLTRRDEIRAQQLTIFTGAIDEFFEFRLGRLRYRGQRRQHLWLGGTGYRHPTVQTNFPSRGDGEFVREIEWKHMMDPATADGIPGTLITREYPISPEIPDHFEYPFPGEADRELYARYVESACRIPNLLICGRLGEYRYYDMDQAIARAMVLFERKVKPLLAA
jgi:UDP-galactopyranose mutase